MPRAPRVCAHQDCSALVHTPGRTRCDQHHQSGWSASPRTASAGRTGNRAWRELRTKVLQRDNHTCQLRYPGCTGTATQVDHRDNIARGGTDHVSNLQAVCKPCHAEKTAREARNGRA